MVKYVLPALCVFGLGLGLVCAQQPPASSAKADTAVVAKWIAKLGSDQYDERETAFATLEALGPAALDALGKAIASPDEETRRRAIDLVLRIEKRQETARLTQPKMTHLVCKDMPVNQAVQELARVTGIQIQLEGDQTKFANRKITLDTGKVPFWQAVDQLCEKAGLLERGSVALPENPVNPVVNGDQVFFLSEVVNNGPRPVSPLVLVDGKSQAAPTHHAGAMRVRILPRLAPNAPGQNDGAPVHERSAGTLLTVEISPEPSLGLQNILSVRVDKAIDEDGNDLKVPMPYISDLVDRGPVTWVRGWANSPDMNRADQDLSKRVPLRLFAPDGVKRLKELRGSVAAEVLTPHQALITVENILNAADRKFSGKESDALTVLDINRDDKGQVVLRIVVEKAPTPQAAFAPAMGIMMFPGGGLAGAPQPADPAINTIAEFLSLVDEKNQAFKLIAAEDQARDAQTNEYRLTFQPPSGLPKPAKLIYSGRRTTTIDVPFVLKDVPVRETKGNANHVDPPAAANNP
jgi:hypothetical protein